MSSIYGTEAANDAAAVTPSDSADLPGGICRSLYVGGIGNIKITTSKGTEVTFNDVSGTLSVKAKRVWSTGTTASGIVALY